MKRDTHVIKEAIVNRSDWLIVTRSGMHWATKYSQVNTVDVTTVQQIVGKIEGKYGKSNRIWVMDRGMTSEDN